MQLAWLALRHVDAPVVPERLTVAGQPAAAAYLEARQQVREIWWKDRDEITTLLLDFDALHKRNYNKDDMPTWFLAMDAFLRGEQPGPELGSTVGFEKFLPERLAKATSVKHTRAGGLPPQHAFSMPSSSSTEPAARSRRTTAPARSSSSAGSSSTCAARSLGARSPPACSHSTICSSASTRPCEAAPAVAWPSPYEHATEPRSSTSSRTPIRFSIGSFARSTEAPASRCSSSATPSRPSTGSAERTCFTYLQAARKAGDRRFTMDTNWRSDPPLLAAVERLFDVPRPFLIEDIGFVPVQPRPGAGPALWRGDTPLPAFELKIQSREGTQVRSKQIAADWAERYLPERVAADISRLLAEGATIRDDDGERPLHAGDIAVLVRKNDQAMRVQRELRQLGIPGVVYGDATVFDTPEAAELYRVLGAVAEPTRSSLLRAAITTELMGVSANTLEAMSSDEDTEWNRWIDDFRRWHEQWVEKGFVQMFRSLLSERSTQQRLLAMLDGERRMTNLLHLAELLHAAATAEHLGPAGLLRWFQQQRRSKSTMVEAVKLRLERDDRAVQLITIHRSKGLEYPVVYCPYLWDGTGLFASEEENLLFHDPDDGERLKIDVRLKPRGRKEKEADPHIALARREKAAENLRLLYVALTRARHRCVIVWGGFYGSHRSPLAYLLGSPMLDPSWPWDPEQVAGKVKALDDDAMLQWLRERGEGVWTLSPLEPGPGTPYEMPAAPPVDLRARQPALAIDRSRRTASFTTMVADREHSRAEASEGRDRDEREEEAEPPTPATTTEGAVPLAEFPRGAKPGNFFHDVLENLTFGPAPTLGESY